MVDRPLRDYQQDAINFVLAGLSTDPAGYYSSPTGTGKTRIVTELVSKISGRILVLAHRKELVEQMADAIIADTGEVPGIIMNVRKQYDFRVCVACVATMTDKVMDEYLETFDADNPYDDGQLTILIDEAHHCVPGSRYETIINYAKYAGLKVRVVGCTATPFRADKLEMQAVLPTCFFERTIPDMQKSGWLCPVTWRSIEIPLDMKAIRTSRTDCESDFNVDDLADQLSPQTEKIISEIKPYLEDRPAVFFCCNIEHAESMAEALRFSGITAGCVHSKLSKMDREETLQRWREGQIQIVTNVGVLTEGFDYVPEGNNPHGLGMVVIARPTKSPSLYLQMLGRGTRLKPKGSQYQDCLCFDVGNANLLETNQCTLPKLLPTVELDDDDESTGKKKKAVRSGYKEDEEKLKEEKKPFILRINDPLSTSWAAWGFYPKSGIYYCDLGSDIYAVMLRGRSGLYRGLLITLDSKTGEHSYTRIVERDKPLIEMMHHVNHLIAQSGIKKLVDKNSKWRREEASTKQLNFIRNSFPDLYCNNLSKGEARCVISWGKLRYPLASIIREMKASAKD